MKHGKTMPFLLLVAISICNIIISFAFGNSGYEAFISLTIALGFLVTWQLLQQVRLVVHRKTMVIIKFLILVAIALFWLVAIAGVMLSVSQNAFDTTASVPDSNWILVVIGAVLYVLPGLIIRTSDTDLRKTVTSSVVSLYSILVMLIAAIGYYTNGVKHHGLILLIALQLQYLMNYIVIQTDYIHGSHVFAENISSRLKIYNTDSRQLLTVFMVGIPFFLPLVIVVLIGFTR